MGYPDPDTYGERFLFATDADERDDNSKHDDDFEDDEDAIEAVRQLGAHRDWWLS